MSDALPGEVPEGYRVVLVTGSKAFEKAAALAKDDGRFIYWTDPYYRHIDLYRDIDAAEGYRTREILVYRMTSLMLTLKILDEAVLSNSIPQRVYLVPAPCFDDHFKEANIEDQGNFALAMKSFTNRYRVFYIWEVEQEQEPGDTAIYATPTTPIDITKTQLMMMLKMGIAGQSMLMSTIRRHAIQAGFKLVRQKDGRMDLPDEVYDTFKAIAESKGTQVVDDVHDRILPSEDRLRFNPWLDPNFNPSQQEKASGAQDNLDDSDHSDDC